MDTSLQPVVADFIAQHKLPEAYADTIEHWFLPLAEEILHKVSVHPGPCVIGISGSQGSGKSTLASLLVRLLQSLAGLRCVNLSIDDFYLTHAERQALSRNVHPLLATRGVPGTHDVPLALATLAGLKQAGEVAIPRFDKAVDDRLPQDKWPHVQAPVDVIILEGWCLSVPAQSESALVAPVNSLESSEDPDGTWRRYVNNAIKQEYGPFYDQVDFLVMLKAPGFDKVYEWRQKQEDHLEEKFRQQQGGEDYHRIMTSAQLQRFIQHYERITRHGLDTLPASADVVFQLTDRQTIDRRL